MCFTGARLDKYVGTAQSLSVLIVALHGRESGDGQENVVNYQTVWPSLGQSDEPLALLCYFSICVCTIAYRSFATFQLLSKLCVRVGNLNQWDFEVRLESALREFVL